MTLPLDLSPQQRQVLEHHTYRGEVTLANGTKSDTYYDIRAAMLCAGCASHVLSHFQDRFEFNTRIVGVGTFGAMFLPQLTAWHVPSGTRRHVSLWLGEKDHGRRWVHSEDAKPREKVTLVDDIVTTGGTLERLEAACVELGFEVTQRVVFFDRR